MPEDGGHASFADEGGPIFLPREGMIIFFHDKRMCRNHLQEVS